MPDHVPFLAHSESASGRRDSVADHLKSVGQTAAGFARHWGGQDEAYVAGILHDLGKYGHLFQRRLQGLASGIDHWSPGAWAALTQHRERGIAAAACIHGHHIGLQRTDNGSLRALSPGQLAERHPLGLTLAEPDVEALLQRLQEDGVQLPNVCQSVYDYRQAGEVPAASMLDIRMLFSALVDADFLETEAHFNCADGVDKTYRSPGPPLDPLRAAAAVARYLATVAARSAASDVVNSVRGDLLAACRVAAEWPIGAFTLTAPTGSGKTLSMLSFAVEHARRFGLHRIIFVLPFLNIIEQTADVLRRVFSEMPETYVLEDHSLVTRPEASSDQSSSTLRERELLAQNWDAPIVVTTSVQFLESLFANRPSTCRKLHRIAESVVLFDEVQTLPTALAIPTLATLSRLSERYRTTIVFSTATQPAFTQLDDHVRKLCPAGWRPREIVPDRLELFSRSKRVKIHWPATDTRTPWEEVAEEIVRRRRVLCIVNIKRHAVEVFQQLRDKGTDGLHHLSTSMCPAHRREVLSAVRERLEDGRSCRLISTQCVEAGVDLDFPTVLRAFAPLDAIAQAAGRCNRHGNLAEGEVRVFVPADNVLYPPGVYTQAAGVARVFVRGERGRLDLDDPASFNRYYGLLYKISRLDQQRLDLEEAIRAQDFPCVAAQYQLIPKATVNVLVPYDPVIYQALATEARSVGLTGHWIARARQYAVSLYRPEQHLDRLEPVRMKFTGEESSDWYLYTRAEHYDSELGLNPSRDDVLIA